MKHTDKFTFLKMEAGKTKEKNRDYIILNLLDNESNPCKFFIFNEEIITKLLGIKPKTFDPLNITYDVIFNNSWSVNLVDVNV